MNKAQPFRQHHITRALKAAAAAGVPNPSVSVRCPNGTIITVDSKPSETGSTGKAAKLSSKRGRR
jgi:hypothetical protein